MKHSHVFILITLGALSLGATLYILTQGIPFPLLSPSGTIGLGERDLMVRAVFLMLIVVIPVVILSVFVAWHYRASNTHATYTPKGEHSVMEELIWWSIPLEIVLVLSALTWSGTHELDPARAIDSSLPPLTVQVVALPWKWLFIYPEEGVASVNELAIPIHRSVRFEITADAPMNSFWIPALGGQMYAMTGMTTVLNLDAREPGEYPGRSANYSGEGFSQMQFTAKAMTAENYASWIAAARNTQSALSNDAYALLRAPSDAGPVRYFGQVGVTFADIANSYMLNTMPTDSHPRMDDMMDMHHH
jgi:cytochrome o ubiquinol oxidase subunit 2